MPTYEYECQKCGHVFEKFQSMSDPRLKRCPECRGAVKRLLGSGAGILFKGSGFYETDYRSENYKSAAKRDSDSGSAKTAASGDSKKSSAGKKKSSDQKPSAGKKGVSKAG